MAENVPIEITGDGGGSSSGTSSFVETADVTDAFRPSGTYAPSIPYQMVVADVSQAWEMQLPGGRGAGELYGNVPVGHAFVIEIGRQA